MLYTILKVNKYKLFLYFKVTHILYDFKMTMYSDHTNLVEHFFPIATHLFNLQLFNKFVL